MPAAIWLAAFAARAALTFLLGHADFSRAEAQNIALSLARNGTFSNAFSASSGPTAQTAPVYPALNALLYLVAGDTLAADQLRVLLNICIAATEYALLPLIARRLGLNPTAGVLAGWLGALMPLYYWGELPGAFENTLAALLLIVTTGLLAPHANGSAITPRRAWLIGAWSGFAVLTSPALLPPIAALLLLIAAKPQPPFSAILRLAAAGLLVISPWVARNYLQLESPALRSNFGLELGVSNNDTATGDADANHGSDYFLSRHPFANAEALRRMQAEGESVYFGRLGTQAVAWIRSHPARFLELCRERVTLFWFPASRYAWHRAALALCTLAAFAGWLILWRQNRPAAVVLAALALSYSLIFVIVQVSIRFSHPVWWILLLGMGALGTELAEGAKTRGSDPHRLRQ